MQKAHSRPELSGVWTALVTPFRRDRVNYSLFAELVQRAHEASLAGVVPLGSTGESSALNSDEQRRLVETAAKAARGNLKVMAGTGTNTTAGTVERTRRAADWGADAALVVAPYYVKPTYAGLKRHFLTVADQSPLPIVLYHIPSRCGVGIPMELVLELARHPRIIGIKEAGGEVWRSGEIARRAPDGFTVLSGDDPLTLPLMAVGAKGVVSVLSNLAPRLVNHMVTRALRGDFHSALAVHQRTAPLLAALSLETNPGPIKAAMEMSGLKVGTVRPPLAPVTAPTRRAIRNALAQLGAVE